MAAKTYYLDDALLNGVLRNIAYVPAAAVYVGLFTVLPVNPSDTGTEVSALGGTLYARQSASFGAPSNGVTTNSAPIFFPVAGASWGTIVGVGIYDNVAGGNLLYYGSLGTSKTVGVGDSVSFAATALSVSEQ
jgi:hypothetical protein